MYYCKSNIRSDNIQYKHALNSLISLKGANTSQANISKITLILENFEIGF